MTSIHCSLQFEKPGKRDDFDYPQMVVEAGNCNLTSKNVIIINSSLLTVLSIHYNHVS